MYTTIIENLTSHGYVVVGINHTFTNLSEFPDGRVIEAIQDKDYPVNTTSDGLWQARIDIALKDINFVLNFLNKLNQDTASMWYHKLNINQLGCLGHSFGSMIPVALYRYNSKFIAGVNIDGWLGIERKNYKPIKQPFLFIINDSLWPGKEYKIENETDITLICKSSPSCKITKVNGSGHFSFSDAALIKWPLNYILDLGTKDNNKILKETNLIILNFFKNNLS